MVSSGMFPGVNFIAQKSRTRAHRRVILLKLERNHNYVGDEQN
jgi:hypothetical protein